jgi:hypothetical protein
MARRKSSRTVKTAGRQEARALELSPKTAKSKSEVHVFGNKIVCDTEPRGHATPGGRSKLRIVVDASEGFIPLWRKGTILRWQFRESSMQVFKSPTAAKAAIRKLFGEAILAWGEGVPVKFSENSAAWDFEIVMRRMDDCEANGCVLASAFFPDPGRHQIFLYPKLFTQSSQEQIETLAHEIGHVFGLRHFFAKLSEAEAPSEIFGVHKRFTIMNYGADSTLTEDDRADLKRLYQQAWNGQLTQINGTPIKLVRAFHTLAPQLEGMVEAPRVQPPQPVPSSKTVYVDAG